MRYRRVCRCTPSVVAAASHWPWWASYARTDATRSPRSRLSSGPSSASANPRPASASTKPDQSVARQICERADAARARRGQSSGSLPHAVAERTTATTSLIPHVTLPAAGRSASTPPPLPVAARRRGPPEALPPPPVCWVGVFDLLDQRNELRRWAVCHQHANRTREQLVPPHASDRKPVRRDAIGEQRQQRRPQLAASSVGADGPLHRKRHEGDTDIHQSQIGGRQWLVARHREEPSDSPSRCQRLQHDLSSLDFQGSRTAWSASTHAIDLGQQRRR